MILKPIPPRSDYPFDPDNPVPNGMQLDPAELRAKYYKVIKPESKFFSGDARYLRDRRNERDPRRTTKFKLMRADGQLFNENTQHYMIDDIARGRWFGKEHADETRVPIDYEAMSQKPCFKHDHDMFSIVSNKYGREYNPDRGPPKTDYIGKNARAAKYGGTIPMVARKKSDDERTRTLSTVTKPTKADLEAACYALVDANAAPFMLHWLESQATSGDKISFMKAFQALSHSSAKKPSAHQKAIAHAQTLRKMIKAGIPPGAAEPRVRSHSVADFRSNENEQLRHHESDVARFSMVNRDTENDSPQRNANKRPSTADGYSSTGVLNQSGGFRPPTAYINSLPFPPPEDDVPPPERRHAGLYPFDWKPRPRVQELKDKLQEILHTKHKALKTSFRRFDEDHHGTVDLSELYRVMVVESGLKCTRAELEEVWDMFDRDRDGQIKYADYSKSMGYDALDERDYFQIAQRKAAGRYNEEVKFFSSKEEMDGATKTQAEDPNSAFNLNLKRAFAKEEEGVTHGHVNLFSLPEQKIGALYNEKFKKASYTIENTHAHNLRLEIAAKLLEKFGSVERAFEHYTEGRGKMSQQYFTLMIADLGLSPSELTISELFRVYDRDLSGRLDADAFCDSFDFDRQVTKPDLFFQDVVLTDVPKHGSRKQHPKPSVQPSRKELEEMLLPKHAQKESIGKLIPARQRKMDGGGGGAAKRRPAEAGHDFRDLPVGSMVPPRPMTALSASGGFDYSSQAANLPQRAATPLQQLQALQKSSAEVRESMGEPLPPRAVSTPPVPGPRAVANDYAPSAMAAADARVNLKVSVPKGVATDFKIRPQTAQHPQDENTPNRKSRPFSAADGFAGGLGAGKNPTKMKRLLGATQPARGRSQDDFQEAVAERMRPTSAADYLPQRAKQENFARPLSAAVQPLMRAPNINAKTGVFAQEASGSSQW